MLLCLRVSVIILVSRGFHISPEYPRPVILLSCMRRFLSISFTLLCALLLISTLFLWFCSYQMIDSWTWGGWSNDPDSDNGRQTTVREESGWIISGRGTLALARRTQQADMSLAAAHDLIAKNAFKGPIHGQQLPNPDKSYTYGKPTGHTFWNRLGFQYDHRLGRSPTTHYYELSIPFRALAALFALPLLIRGAFFLFRKSCHLPHACPACGYDLRATPTRCPECGHTPSTALTPQHPTPDIDL